MATTSRINHLTMIAKKRQETNKNGDLIRRFRDARKRGMFLCKDGKERTFQEWLETLPPELAAKILKIAGNPE